MAFYVSNIYKSLVRHLTDTVDAIKKSGVAPGIEYYSWDSRGEENELPNVDLIGLAGWTLHENPGLWLIHAGISISTINDDHLFREASIIDAIHERWGEECAIPMRDDTGAEYTQLVVKEFEMLPSGQSELRNYRGIGLELKRTANA